jgi:hypothetical protein
VETKRIGKHFSLSKIRGPFCVQFSVTEQCLLREMAIIEEDEDDEFIFYNSSRGGGGGGGGGVLLRER